MPSKTQKILIAALAIMPAATAALADMPPICRLKSVVQGSAYALFTGGARQEKATTARALADSLGLEFIRVDLSRLVSENTGETERNLDRIFDQADSRGALLFLDEADTLMGRRSEVKDARDRYANVETSYLLQRVERYEGMAVLVTNLKKNIDTTGRKLRVVVDFPGGDAGPRQQLKRCP